MISLSIRGPWKVSNISLLPPRIIEENEHGLERMDAVPINLSVIL